MSTFSAKQRGCSKAPLRGDRKRHESGEVCIIKSNPGFHVVNYSLTLAEMVKEAGFKNWRMAEITSDRFPVKGKGLQKFEDTLFHFSGDIEWKDAIRRIVAFDKSNNPWRPAKIENLLFYSIANPRSHLLRPIMALGSVCMVCHLPMGSEQPYVPYIYRFGKRARIALRWTGISWNFRTRFLAVRRIKR